MPCPRAGLTPAVAPHLTAAHHPPQSPTHGHLPPPSPVWALPHFVPRRSPHGTPRPSSPHLPTVGTGALDSWGSSRHLAPTARSTPARRPRVGCGETTVAFLGVQATPTPPIPTARLRRSWCSPEEARGPAFTQPGALGAQHLGQGPPGLGGGQAGQRGRDAQAGEGPGRPDQGAAGSMCCLRSQSWLQ